MQHATPLTPLTGATPPGPLYNFSALGRLAHDPGFVRELKQVFVQDVPPKLQELRAALAAGQWEAVARAAHSLKSMVAMLGLELVVATLREVEQRASAGTRLGGLPALLPPVELTLAAVLAELRGELAAPAGQD